MNRIKGIYLVLNWKSLVIAFLSVSSTYLCEQLDLTADFPLALITIAVVFPIVFSIGGAYKRRETALDQYGHMKAHGRAIYFAARDWLENSHPDVLKNARDTLGELLKNCRDLFIAPVEDTERFEREIYLTFSRLSKFIKGLRKYGLASGEASRLNQYLSKMMVAFESIKHIYQYRTPKSLRAYSDIFIVLLPVLYGPYFAQFAGETAPGLQYVLPVLLSIILVSLDNIQDHLENPFDQIGADDVMINAEKFVSLLESE